MSIHLTTVPLPVDKINKAIDISDLDKNSKGVDFKISTPMSDMNCMQDILEHNLLGFKNKRSLLEFQDKGVIYYYYSQNNNIDIAFIGNFPKNEAITFINNLNYAYLSQTNQLDLFKEIPYDIEKVEPVMVKKFKINTTMKNKDIIDSILNESTVGYDSKEKLQKFIATGQMTIKKTEDDSLDFIFIGDYDEDESKDFIRNLTDEYCSKVQEITYEKLLEKIKEKNLVLESENVDKDDSIILTLSI